MDSSLYSARVLCRTTGPPCSNIVTFCVEGYAGISYCAYAVSDGAIIVQQSLQPSRGAAAATGPAPGPSAAGAPTSHQPASRHSAFSAPTSAPPSTGLFAPVLLIDRVAQLEHGSDVFGRLAWGGGPELLLAATTKQHVYLFSLAPFFAGPAAALPRCARPGTLLPPPSTAYALVGLYRTAMPALALDWTQNARGLLVTDSGNYVTMLRLVPKESVLLPSASGSLPCATTAGGGAHGGSSGSGPHKVTWIVASVGVVGHDGPDGHGDYAISAYVAYPGGMPLLSAADCCVGMQGAYAEVRSFQIAPVASSAPYAAGAPGATSTSLRVSGVARQAMTGSPEALSSLLVHPAADVALLRDRTGGVALWGLGPLAELPIALAPDAASASRALLASAGQLAAVAWLGHFWRPATGHIRGGCDGVGGLELRGGGPSTYGTYELETVVPVVDTVSALSWLPAAGLSACLAVGFASGRVALLARDRAGEWEELASYGGAAAVAAFGSTAAGGGVAVAAGNHLLCFSNTLDCSDPARQQQPSLAALAADLNGPLPPYHPGSVHALVAKGRLSTACHPAAAALAAKPMETGTLNMSAFGAFGDFGGGGAAPTAPPAPAPKSVLDTGTLDTSAFGDFGGFGGGLGGGGGSAPLLLSPDEVLQLHRLLGQDPPTAEQGAVDAFGLPTAPARIAVAGARAEAAEAEAAKDDGAFAAAVSRLFRPVSVTRAAGGAGTPPNPLSSDPSSSALQQQGGGGLRRSGTQRDEDLSPQSLQLGSMAAAGGLGRHRHGASTIPDGGGAAGSSSASLLRRRLNPASRSNLSIPESLFGGRAGGPLEEGGGGGADGAASSGTGSWWRLVGLLPGLDMRSCLAAAASGSQAALLAALLPELPWAAAADEEASAAPDGRNAGGLGESALAPGRGEEGRSRQSKDSRRAGRPSLSWPLLRKAGAGFWLTDPRVVREQAEYLAKAQFARRKEPYDCALIYLALGRKALLVSLFRHELAAGFFILAGQHYDAVSVLCRERRDPQLALLPPPQPVLQPLAADAAALDFVLLLGVQCLSGSRLLAGALSYSLAEAQRRQQQQSGFEDPLQPGSAPPSGPLPPSVAETPVLTTPGDSAHGAAAAYAAYPASSGGLASAGAVGSSATPPGWGVFEAPWDVLAVEGDKCRAVAVMRAGRGGGEGGVAGVEEAQLPFAVATGSNNLMVYQWRFAGVLDLSPPHWGHAAALRYSSPGGGRFVGIGEGGLVAMWRADVSGPGGLGYADWTHHCVGRHGRDVCFVGDSSSQVLVAGQGDRGGLVGWWDSLAPPGAASSCCVAEIRGRRTAATALALLRPDAGGVLVFGDESGELVATDLRMMAAPLGLAVAAGPYAPG
eukprot:XP_001692194.1 predicted protein [Chlamydomonas reinhardtii]